MEKALFISKVENLKYFNKDYTRLYFGNEFCENLIPTINELSKVLSFISRKKLDFTFVTPYITNKGLKKLQPLIDLVSKENKEAEIVTNDWGLLKLVNSKKLKPVLGRLLVKMKKGPRILNLIGNTPEETINPFRKSNIEVPIFQRFLQENNIERVEIDNLLQGIDLDLSTSHLKGSLYIPFIYLTTTRRCLINSSDLISKEDIIGIYPCHRECQNYTAELKHELMPKTIILKGNTQFVKNEKIPNNLEKNGVNRLVYQPEIPI